MTGPDLKPRIRDLFLDDANTYGCAEVALIALQEHFGLPDAGDASAAMALNGGIAYSGGMCGALTGSALAAGRLAGRLLLDHAQAKHQARQVTQALMADFVREFRASSCRDLTGYDFMEPGQHHAFIVAGEWRRTCLRQIEFAVEGMSRLVADAGWGREAAVPPAERP